MLLILITMKVSQKSTRGITRTLPREAFVTEEIVCQDQLLPSQPTNRTQSRRRRSTKPAGCESSCQARCNCWSCRGSFSRNSRRTSSKRRALGRLRWVCKCCTRRCKKYCCLCSLCKFGHASCMWRKTKQQHQQQQHMQVSYTYY